MPGDADTIFWSRCKFCGEGLGPFKTFREAERIETCEFCDLDYDNALIERDDRFSRDLLAGFDRVIKQLTHDEDCECPDCASFPGHSPG